jgi:hypothetical protein
MELPDFRSPKANHAGRVPSSVIWNSTPRYAIRSTLDISQASPLPRGGTSAPIAPDSTPPGSISRFWHPARVLAMAGYSSSSAGGGWSVS